MRTVRGRGQGQDTRAAQLAHGAAELAASPPSVPPPPAPSSSSSVSPAAFAHIVMDPGSLEESPSTLGDKRSGLASWSPSGVKLAYLLSCEDNSFGPGREAGAASDV